MQTITTVTSKGQVTIPLQFRRALNIKPGQKVEFQAKSKKNTLTMKPVKDIFDLEGIFKSNKKYDKKKARETFIPLVVAGKI